MFPECFEFNPNVCPDQDLKNVLFSNISLMLRVFGDGFNYFV